MPQSLHQISLSPKQFRQRFTVLTQFNDPFAREYFITTDQQTKKRSIYKHYLAQTNEQLQAIFDNIENYIKLSEQQDICKITACTRLLDEQQVLAAFEYDQYSLAEYISTAQFASNRPLFYVQLLSSLAFIIKSMTEIGIDVDQLNYGNILVFMDGEEAKVKVFYDEREKTYDKILEGMKTFTSIEKLTALITGNQDYFNQLMEREDPISPENIYQLGLLLIDLLYTSQTNQVTSSEDDFLSRDRPVSRSSILNPDKGYYQIQDGRIVTLNEDYLNEKLSYLENNCSHIVKELSNLARYMIAKQQERITLMELLGEVDRMFKIYRDSSKKVVRVVSADEKKGKIPNEDLKQQGSSISKKSSQSKKSSSHNSSSKNINEIHNQNVSQSQQANEKFGNSVQKNTISRSVNESGSSSVSNINQKAVHQIQTIDPFRYNSHQESLGQAGYRNQEYNENTYKVEDYDTNGNNYHSTPVQTTNWKAEGFNSSPKREHEQKKNNADTLHSTKDHLSNPLGQTLQDVNSCPTSINEGYFSSFSSQKNDYTSFNQKDEKLRQPTNSNALSTTKQTIGSKTNYTAHVINEHFSHNSNATLYETQKSKNASTTQNTFNVSNQKPIKMIIPKEHILMNLRAHESIKASLETLIKEVQALSQLKKKEYYDNSVYYGEVSPKTNKRSGLGLYVYPSGDIYFGTWLENQLINGTYIFKNGQSYEGSVKNGKQGWGRYRYSNGNVYEGEWKDDIKEGKGTMWYPNQDKYEGQWVKGKKNGWGKYFYNNGTIYEGNFINGRKHGFGTIMFSNGTKIEANWHQTHVEGQGKVFYPNGDFFHGEYYMSQKHGKGLYVWGSDNTKYEGQFKKDSLEGDAKIYFTSNEYYFGRIRKGKRDGQGTYAYENGDMFNGEWKNDLKLIGHYKFKNGDEFEGKFKENQLNFGVLKYSNGEVYEGEFRNGYRHGVGSYRSREGEVVCEGHWENDSFISNGQ